MGCYPCTEDVEWYGQVQWSWEAIPHRDRAREEGFSVGFGSWVWQVVGSGVRIACGSCHGCDVLVSLVDTDKAVVSLVHHAEPGLLSPLCSKLASWVLAACPQRWTCTTSFWYNVTGSPALRHLNFVAIGGCVWVTHCRGVLGVGQLRTHETVVGAVLQPFYICRASSSLRNTV